MSERGWEFNVRSLAARSLGESEVVTVYSLKPTLRQALEDLNLDSYGISWVRPLPRFLTDEEEDVLMDFKREHSK